MSSVYGNFKKSPFFYFDLPSGYPKEIKSSHGLLGDTKNIGFLAHLLQFSSVIGEGVPPEQDSSH